jgi:hypothetical protein
MPLEVDDVLAWGFLEYFFAGMLSVLVIVVGVFALFVAGQLVRNPGRRDRTRP